MGLDEFYDSYDYHNMKCNNYLYYNYNGSWERIKSLYNDWD